MNELSTKTLILTCKTSQSTANCDKPIKMWQLISSAESYFASFVYPLRLAISRREIFTFVDCFCLLSDTCRLGASHSHIWTQAQIASECFVDALL